MFSFCGVKLKMLTVTRQLFRLHSQMPCIQRHGAIEKRIIIEELRRQLNEIITQSKRWTEQTMYSQSDLSSTLKYSMKSRNREIFPFHWSAICSIIDGVKHIWVRWICAKDFIKFYCMRHEDDCAFASFRFHIYLKREIEIGSNGAMLSAICCLLVIL